MSQGTELNFKTKKSSEKISENIHIFANDPSLAFFRIQEHVRKVLPAILEKRTEVLTLQNNLQGHCYDMEYGVQALKSIENSKQIFQNIQEITKTSIFLKQQLQYVENRNKTKKDSSRNSVYKRFSAHLTIDLPELPDFSSHFGRESTHRLESTTPGRTEAASIQGSLTELQRSHTTLH
ncbi:BLOC-1-related complex subunit 8 homolog isoform X1 [Scaptodrosophila lebanonensis]|uniref:BLOC-1-related complex subunit 8 homolog isoform X1 n=1 Tax=Drosophila lebanonensis TaxID=7225 RepID=A0A6J2U763_DROLE|nr:BLOC-1-related complex subunit 8 homolog isoform X1 [Scaptodrosophila lebanonensis]